MNEHECPLTAEDVNQVKFFKSSNERISRMQEDIQSLKDDVKDIKEALIGDKFNPGFRQRIEKVEADTFANTEQLHRLRSFWVAFISILGIAGTIFGIAKIFI